MSATIAPSKAPTYKEMVDGSHLPECIFFYARTSFSNFFSFLFFFFVQICPDDDCRMSVETSAFL